MKLYTFYTDSHEKLLKEYFLPSIPKEDNFEIIVEKFQQECSSGNFMENGWIDTMHKKVLLILKGIEENWGQVFVHSDCDLYFFKPFKEQILNEIHDYDLVGQHDGGNSICCGFFACKGNDKTKKLFEAVLNDISKNNNDQHSFNKLKNNYIKSKVLNNKFFNVNSLLNGQVWSPGIDLNIDKNIFLVHANWTLGVENKCKLIDYVKGKIK